jgi:hypothetical protein
MKLPAAALAALCGLALALAVPLRAQYSGAPAEIQPSAPMPAVSFPRQHIPAYLLARMRQQRERENQAKIRQESVRLLALARQLHALLAATNIHILPVAALRQCRQIDKIARRLQKRLKNGQ